LSEALPVISAGKPLFIDKPAAGSLRDVLEIYRQAREHNVPIFSGSSLRYYPNLQAMKTNDLGELRGADTSGPAELESHHPDLFWYGIHAAEVLYTIMGTGCESVTCTATPDTHFVTGVWRGGKIGTLRGVRHAPYQFRATVFGSKKVLDEQLSGDYTPFLREVVKFFQTGVAPVSAGETIEIYAFMEAADESRQAGGCPVKISDVMEKNTVKLIDNPVPRNPVPGTPLR
jgi:predicted dehydrogenase